MPDKDGFPTPEEIINGGKKPAEGPKIVPLKGTPDRVKALQLLASGMPFVMIALRPTTEGGKPSSGNDDITGADLFVAMESPKDINDFLPLLHDAVQRELHKRGIF